MPGVSEPGLPAREAAMPNAARYSSREYLRDGCPVEIRALRPEDQAGMLSAVDGTGAQSLQRRFFAVKRHFSDRERAFFMDTDFKNHVALVVLVEDAGQKAIVGGGRYVVFEPERAEMAFMVVDSWQGRGIGSILMRHLIKLASEAGLKEVTAEVLPDNIAMRRVFDKFGFKPGKEHDPQIIHLALTIT
jgi:RimJ/RimL family protein N-acetyltransferase